MAERIVAILGTRFPDLAIEESVLARLGARIVAGPGDRRGSVVQVAGEAEVILAGTSPRFDADTLDGLPACRGIVRYGVGVESIDLAAAHRLGIRVARVPDYATEAVAVHALTMGLAGIRRLLQADAALRRGEWSFAELRPLRLPASLTAGVVGLGRIGLRVAELLRAVGFGRILTHDPIVDPPQWAVSVDLTDLLSQADLITLHAPPTPAGPLLGAGELALLRPGSVLVNTARGALIDPEALAEGLRRGRPTMAALDVFDPEPPELAPFGEVVEQLIVTPHMAWYTEETEQDLRLKAAEEAGRLLQSEEPLNPVVFQPLQTLLEGA
ncbi:MAG: NAD(P)-dependent oxidoreductase [Acidimicrobiia bacterium]